MAENKLQLDVVSPSRSLISCVVDEVVLPGVEGCFGVLPDHMDFISTLRVGEIVLRNDAGVEYILIDGGWAKAEDNKVVVLAEDAVLGAEIDLEEAIKRKAESEMVLSEKRIDDQIKFKQAEAALQRSIAEIAIARKLGK